MTVGTERSRGAVAVKGAKGFRKIPLHERFWDRVQKTEGCWLWMGYRSPRGYGQTSVNHRRVPAHRASWYLTHGEWPPDDLEVRHTCDNPPCVRPDHLLLGTHADNMRDWFERGDKEAIRKLLDVEHRRPFYKRGESHARAKLSDDQGRQIRALRGTMTQREIAAKFGTSLGVVRDIMIARGRWTFLAEEVRP